MILIPLNSLLFIMIRTQLEVHDMACPMCEAHVVEAVRDAFPDVKFSDIRASHRKNRLECVTECALDADRLRQTVSETGYGVGDFSSEEVQPGFFSRCLGRLFG